MGLTVSRKVAKNLYDKRENLQILSVILRKKVDLVISTMERY